MDQKPKTRGSPKKAAKPKAKDEKQFERFIETARNIGVDDDDEKFGSIVSTIARAGRNGKNS